MKTRLVQMIPFVANNPRLLPALIIYTVFFFILSVSGIWENVPVKRTDDIPPRTDKKKLSDTAKNTLYNFTIILYLPLLLPFRILGTFGTVLYSIISTYTDEFIHNILKIILLPFMVFNIIGRKFDKNHIQNRLRSLKAYFLQLIRNKKKDKSIKSKLKIYQQYTKELANIDGSFIRDYELSLKSWLCNTPLYLQLQWFDTVENVDVSVKLKRRRWTSEITARDALYLEKLGVILS